MLLREEHDRRTWDALTSSVSQATFLQSWAWGEGQAKLGKVVKRFVVEKDGNACFLAQAIEERRRGLSYWFVPGGPVGVERIGNKESGIEFGEWEKVVGLLKKKLLYGRSVFLRVEPFILLDSRFFIPDTPPWIPTRSFNPAVHWMIDLRGKTEEQILTEMDQKTRYNVRLGERHGVATRLTTEPKDFEAFLSLMHEMGTRNGITVHSDHYLRTTFFAMAKLGMAKLRVAELDGKMLAGSVEVSFGDTLTYLHGASSSSMRDVKAPQVLQWHAVQEARRHGYSWYDFGGCNPVDQKRREYKKSLEGVTRFKEGWGGGRVEFVGTFVVPRFSFMRWFL